MQRLQVEFQNGFEDGELVPIEHVVQPHRAIDDGLDEELREIVERMVRERCEEMVWEALTRFSVEILSHDKPKVTVTSFAFAAGLYVLEGKSITQLAHELSEGNPPGHPLHITKQALSKRITNICKQLGLPPSRGMKSEQARETYKQAQLKRGQNG